jgi:hypothetical protein
MPWWFIIYLLLFTIALISACIRRLPKFRKRVIPLSKDKRDKLIYSYAKIINICKIMFIASPIYLIILPYYLYRYRPSQEFIYGTAMLILMYLMLLETFLFKKSIVKEIQIMGAKEVSTISPDISPGQ